MYLSTLTEQTREHPPSRAMSGRLYKQQRDKCDGWLSAEASALIYTAFS
jgi:hypothetical protein